MRRPYRDPDRAARPTPSRRAFLQRLAGGATVLASGAPATALAARSLQAVAEAAAQPISEERFWEKVRREFMLSDTMIYLNNGTLGPTPKPVFYTAVEGYRELGQDPGWPNELAQTTPLFEQVRAKAAAFTNAHPDEIALTRNTTEGMSLLANGADLKAGDEVLVTFHEHPSGLEPWRLKARKVGIVVKEVKFPIPPRDPADILNVFGDAITARTRVLSVSHATFPTGCFLPIKELAALAHAKGLLLFVDGAHPLGMVPLDLHDLGVDAYASSPHKWLTAPTGTGFLYVRREVQDRIWPTVVTSGWDDPKAGARRYDRLSQRATPLVAAVGGAIDFQMAIGRERIEQRIRKLSGLLRKKLEAIDGITLYTSPHPALHGGLTGFRFEPFKNRDIVETLWRRHRIWVRYTEFGLNTVRVSTHYYNTEEQIERLIEALEDIRRRGVIQAAAADPVEAGPVE